MTQPSSPASTPTPTRAVEPQASPRPARPRPGCGARTLAMVIGLLAALAAGEVLVRASGRAPEVAPVRYGRLQLSADPKLVFEPVPGFTWHGDQEPGAGEAGAFEYRGTSNSLGYRDREHRREKAPGTFRIAVLGDSIAAGYRVERTADAFPALLEARLRERGLPVEVLNFGVTGYNTAQEVHTLRVRALAFAPDLVVLAYCHNDRRPPDPRIVAGLREAGAGRTAVASTRLDHWLLPSALYRTLRFVVFAPRETTAPGGDTVDAAFAELATLAGEHDLPVLVAVFPYLRQLWEAEHDRQHRRLAGLAARHGFQHLDLRPAFQACRGGDSLRFDRYHPTAAGHRCAATAIAAAVEPLVRAATAAAEAGGPTPQPAAR